MSEVTSNLFVQTPEGLVGPSIYKVDNKEKVREFFAVVNGDSYHMVTGLQDGKKVKSAPTICKPKNAGKKNETTGEQQAMKEACAKYKKKIKSNYCLSLEEAIANGSGGKFFYPQRAIAKRPKTAVVENIIYDPKLDGSRLTVTKDEYISRSGEHVHTVKFLFERMKDWLIAHPTVRLDGELYNHTYKDRFNDLMSLIRKEKLEELTEEQLQEIEDVIQFHIYDCYFTDNPDATAIERKQWLAKQEELFALDSVMRVPYFHISDFPQFTTFKELEDYLVEELVEKQGYEGLIGRRMDAPYQTKQTNDMFKVKQFITEEFTILDIQEGKGNAAGLAATAVIDTPNRDCPTFTGTKAWRKEVWENKDKYIGTQATIKYMFKMPTGGLRHPNVIDVNRPDLVD